MLELNSVEVLHKNKECIIEEFFNRIKLFCYRNLNRSTNLKRKPIHLILRNILPHAVN